MLVSLRTYTAVSYTHLDVYKRQLEERGVKLDSVIDEGGAVLNVDVPKILKTKLAGIGIAEKRTNPRAVCGTTCPIRGNTGPQENKANINF